MRSLRGCLLVLFLALSNMALAGSRGYHVVLVNIGDEDFFASKTYEAFRDGGTDPLDTATDCWNRSATDGRGIEFIARKDVPKGLDQALGKAIWHRDRKAVASAQRLLRTGRGNGQAYDGMYVVLPAAHTISIVGVGAVAKVSPKNPSPVVRMAWNRSSLLEAAARLDEAFCRASAPLDVGFGP